MIKTLLLLLSIVFQPLHAEEIEKLWSSQGEVGLEYRRFENDSSSLSEETGVSIFTRIEGLYKDNIGKHTFRGFGRVDKEDPDRSIIAIEEAHFNWMLGVEQDFEFLVGYKLFNWTATEAFHPADVINSRNFDSDIENLEKVGEPTIQMKWLLDDGAFSIFFWPLFERPKFPGYRSRLGTGTAIDRPQLINGQEVSTNYWKTQMGMRWQTTFFENADASFHIISHYDRNNPLLGTHQFTTIGTTNIPLDLAKLTTSPTPYYFIVNQLGGTYQHPIGALIFKLEGAVRSYSDTPNILTANGVRTTANHSEFATGIEYLIPHETSGAESNLILEFNSIFGVDEERRAELGIFQRDVMFAIRHAYNDTMGTELFASFFMDIERSNERLFTASYSRRLSDDWKLKGGLRIYDAPKKGTTPKGLEVFDGNNHFTFTLTRFF